MHAHFDPAPESNSELILLIGGLTQIQELEPVCSGVASLCNVGNGYRLGRPVRGSRIEHCV